MSRDGRIGNRSALKRLADFLQMEGVNRAPADLHREQLLPVVDLAQLGGDTVPAAAYQALTWGAESQQFALGAANFAGGKILAADLVNDRKILTAEIEFISGAAAIADLPVRLKVTMQHPVLSPGVDRNVAHHRPWTHLGNVGQNYRTWCNNGWTLIQQGQVTAGGVSAGWDGFVPAGVEMYYSIATTDATPGSNWPADAVINSNLSWVAVPAGRRLPL